MEALSTPTLAPASALALRASISGLLEAIVRGDVTDLQARVAPSFEIVHLTGRRQTRTAWLADIAAGRLQYHSVGTSRFAVGGTAEAPILATTARLETTVGGAYAVWPVELKVTLQNRPHGPIVVRCVVTLRTR